MKKILFFALLHCCGYQVIAQDVPLTIHPESKKIYRGDYPCMYYDLTQMMQPDKEASRYIKSAHNSIVFSVIFGISGGIVFGRQVGVFLITGDVFWPFFSAGAGLIGLSIAHHQWNLRQTTRAVTIYNGTLNQSLKPRSELGLRFSANGIGLMLSL